LFNKTFKSSMQIFVNGKAMQLAAEAMSVQALVEQMQLTGKRIAIERNGDIVPRSQFAQVQLHADDKLEIVGAVGGG
jgi:sulfur carrier protein